MLEKSQLHANDADDVTRVKSADSSESTLPSKPYSQTSNDEATQMATGHSDTDSSADSQLTIGSVIKNTYQLVQVLGEGGMGTVFKALNKVWEEVEARDPYVAIKVLKPELSANKQLVRSLYSDFDRTKMLANCPNIIKVHGFDRDGSHVYMTMEYLSGKTLGDYLNRQPMNLTQAWFIIEGIGNALAYAHEHNIVHRDIKPGNVIITDDNIVKVLDFGIASKINENEGDETKFGGHELGALTVAYASPEMQRDFPPDARDDIYAFACVIYEILTGKQFYKQKINKAAGIHGLNTRQMDILNKSLAFERDQRTATIRELLDKLRPAKTAWVKYAAMGGGAILTIAVALWSTQNYIATPPKPNTQKETVKITAEDETAKIAAELKAKEDAARVAAELKAKEDAAKVAAELKAQEDAAKVAAELKAQEEAAKIAAELKAKQQDSHIATSSDGIVQLQTSKPEYKNGESFHLSFTLTQPSYVRIIDRDAKGQVTTLRPNALQPDKLLPADKKQLFPPNNIEVPVQGIAGNSTVTIVASSKPFPKNFKLINMDGSISEQVQNESYSWTQVHYTLSH